MPQITIPTTAPRQRFLCADVSRKRRRWPACPARSVWSNLSAKMFFVHDHDVLGSEESASIIAMPQLWPFRTVSRDHHARHGDAMSSFLRTCLVAAIVLTALASDGAALAQGTQAGRPELVAMSVIDVKPDLTSEFGALQADAMAAQRAGGQAWRETWHTATFGHPYRVVVLSPVTTLDHFDGQSYTVKGVGAAAASAINERARRMIAHQQIYLLERRADLGIGTRAAKHTLAVVSFLSVVPGREAEFEKLLKTEVQAALRKAGVGYYGVSRVVYGGDVGQYVTVLTFENFADLGRGHPLERALGADGLSRLQAKLAGAITKIERHVLRFNQALSFPE